MRHNPQLWYALLSVGVALAGGGLLALSDALRTQGYIGVVTAAFVFGIPGLLMIILGATSALLYAPRVPKMARILRDERPLAHWHYTLPEWQGYLAHEVRSQRAEKLKLFRFINGLTVMMGALFAIVLPNRFMAAVWGVVVVALLTSIPTFVLPLITHYRVRNSPGQAYISRYGLYLNGSLHAWDPLEPMGTGVHDIVLQDGTPPLLVFTVRYPSSYTQTTVTVRVPVPEGEQQTAQRVIDYFS